jgi:hypothetical protein
METVRDWIGEHPPPDERFTQTAALSLAAHR